MYLQRELLKLWKAANDYGLLKELNLSDYLKQIITAENK